MTRQVRIIAVLLFLGVMGMGYLCLLRPLASDIKVARGAYATLLQQLEHLEHTRVENTRLVAELDRLLALNRRRIKTIPIEPGTAELIHEFSQPGMTPRSSVNFSTALSVPLESPGGTSMRYVPLAIEFEGDFSRFYALLRDAENKDRLIRIASVNVESSGEKLMGTVDLELVYQPISRTDGSSK